MKRYGLGPQIEASHIKLVGYAPPHDAISGDRNREAEHLSGNEDSAHNGDGLR